jgi:hypothetical protein
VLAMVDGRQESEMVVDPAMQPPIPLSSVV